MWEQLRDPWTLGFGYAVPEFVDSEGLVKSLGVV